MGEDKNPPIPKPNFLHAAEILKRARGSIGFATLSKLPSFGRIRLQEDIYTSPSGEVSDISDLVIPDAQSYTINRLHAMIKGVGRRFGELLVEPGQFLNDCNPDLPSITKKYQTDPVVTLHFCRETDPSFSPVTLPNNAINRSTLAKRCFLLGQFAGGMGIDARPLDHQQIIGGDLGNTITIPDRMGEAYEAIYAALRERGLAEDVIQEMMVDSHLDIDKNVLECIERDLVNPSALKPYFIRE